MYLKVIVYSLLVFGSMYFVHLTMTKKAKKRERILQGIDEPESEKDQRIAVGGSWVLKDLDGNDFGSHSLYGSYYLLYFGFSLCPDVCPFSLAKLSKVARKLRESREGQQYFQVKPVFVSTNPEYDTPKKLIEFAELY